MTFGRQKINHVGICFNAHVRSFLFAKKLKVSHADRKIFKCFTDTCQISLFFQHFPNLLYVLIYLLLEFIHLLVMMNCSLRL